MFPTNEKCQKRVSAASINLIFSNIKIERIQNIYYRENKHFHQSRIFEELGNANFNVDCGDPDENYEFPINGFLKIVIKQVPLKKEFLKM